MIGAISASVGGLLTAIKTVEKAAESVAQNGAGDNLAEDMVALKTAEISAKANLKTLETAAEMQEELLNSLDIEV